MHFSLSSAILLCWIGIFQPVASKVYDRCELARQLRDVYKFPRDQLSTWVCIAYHESRYNTSAHNTKSGDHGIFQINQRYWCSPPGKGCGVSCAALRDNNINDDVECAKKVYRDTKKFSKNGFTAWVTYNRICKNKQTANKFTAGCF